jgi:hypothetical protein
MALRNDMGFRRVLLSRGIRVPPDEITLELALALAFAWSRVEKKPSETGLGFRSLVALSPPDMLVAAPIPILEKPGVLAVYTCS